MRALRVSVRERAPDAKAGRSERTRAMSGNNSTVGGLSGGWQGGVPGVSSRWLTRQLEDSLDFDGTWLRQA
ncbi:MAG: hypothetical protein CVU63_01485 [Deltaproteobacteria bacterium HGW-Deltaproteobacteria-20]|nr:MAG: hypothetical protein CVU63_01485 [Deltaproteobacteria bacterium HGW-Deltaproteobacteria-20]